MGQVRRGAGGAPELERTEEDGRGGAVCEMWSTGGGILYSTIEER